MAGALVLRIEASLQRQIAAVGREQAGTVGGAGAVGVWCGVGFAEVGKATVDATEDADTGAALVAVGVQDVSVGGGQHIDVAPGVDADVLHNHLHILLAPEIIRRRTIRHVLDIVLTIIIQIFV